MSEEKENGMVVIAAVVIVVLMMICALTSCGSRKAVTDLQIVHDTLFVAKVDTLRIEKVHTITDTIRDVITKEITLLRDTARNKVDTIKVENIRDHYRYISVGDSSGVYRVAVDSILKALDRQKTHEVVKTSTGAMWWQYAAISIVFLFGCIAVLKFR